MENNKTLSFLLFLLCAFFLFSCAQTKEREIRLSEDDLLIFTEHAFLEGYQAALFEQNSDTVWVKLSSEYKEIFK